MNGYIWYSFGSDTSGQKLAQALGFQCGKDKPDFSAYDIVVGFGCKPKQKVGTIPEVTEGLLRIVNHPDTVQENRNKLLTLRKLSHKDSGVRIPGFVGREQGELDESFFDRTTKALASGLLAFPIVGLNKFHKGKQILCYTLGDLQQAQQQQAKRQDEETELDYFRSLCVGTEYRIHVLRDVAFCAQVKAPAEDPKKQSIASLRAALEKKARREGLDHQIVEGEPAAWVLEQMVEELLQGPGQLLQSVGRGWILKEIPQAPEIVLAEAVNALDVVGLDLGAVSVVYNEETQTPRVTGITTGPAISDTQLPHYVEAFKAFVHTGYKALQRARPVVNPATPELLAKLTRKLQDVDAQKLAIILKVLEQSETKS